MEQQQSARIYPRQPEKVIDLTCQGPTPRSKITTRNDNDENSDRHNDNNDGNDRERGVKLDNANTTAQNLPEEPAGFAKVVGHNATILIKIDQTQGK